MLKGSTLERPALRRAGAVRPDAGRHDDRGDALPPHAGLKLCLATTPSLPQTLLPSSVRLAQPRPATTPSPHAQSVEAAPVLLIDAEAWPLRQDRNFSRAHARTRRTLANAKLTDGRQWRAAVRVGPDQFALAPAVEYAWQSPVNTRDDTLAEVLGAPSLEQRGASPSAARCLAAAHTDQSARYRMEGRSIRPSAVTINSRGCMRKLSRRTVRSP